MKTLVKELFVRYSYDDWKVCDQHNTLVKVYDWTVLPVYADDDTLEVIAEFEYKHTHDINILSVNLV